MSLFLISTPIGNLDDITLRALKKLKESDHIIGEEAKVIRRRLSAWGIKPQDKKIHTLNEHTDLDELNKLLELVEENDVSLVTDCGTPSFFDPGFALVKKCVENKVEVKSLPGVSSLTALMPYLDRRTEHFEVLGFPPQKKEERPAFYKKIASKKNPSFIMDTPYRLDKVIDELKLHLPHSYCVLGLNLTEESESILRGTPEEIRGHIPSKSKVNFVCMIYTLKT